MNPIFDGLVSGDQYSSALLACHKEEVDNFWSWWWRNHPKNQLDRTKTVQDGDDWLVPTHQCRILNTESHSEFFSDHLIRALTAPCMPRGDKVPRAHFREGIVKYLSGLGVAQNSRVVVFAGGGYGTGKTTSLSFLAKANNLGIPLSSVLGVDHCKALIPEFDRLKAVGDGRASEVCQAESRLISELLFENLVKSGLSFGWDSSMSDRAESSKRIIRASSARYLLTLVAVYTTPEKAVIRAMERAQETRRFAHPDHFHPSAQNFWKNFAEYVPEFDKVFVIDNSEDWIRGSPTEPIIIAEKHRKEDLLNVLDSAKFERIPIL